MYTACMTYTPAGSPPLLSFAVHETQQEAFNVVSKFFQALAREFTMRLVHRTTLTYNFGVDHIDRVCNGDTMPTAYELQALYVNYVKPIIENTDFMTARAWRMAAEYYRHTNWHVGTSAELETLVVLIRAAAPLLEQPFSVEVEVAPQYVEIPTRTKSAAPR